MSLVRKIALVAMTLAAFSFAQEEEAAATTSSASAPAASATAPAGGVAPGTFGVGYAGAFGGMNTMHFTYQLSSTVGLGLNLGMVYTKPKDVDGALDLLLGLRGVITMLNYDPVALQFAPAFLIGIPDGGDKVILIQAPLRVEWFVASHLSLSAMAGFEFDVSKPVNRLYMMGDLLGGVGITLWIF